MIMDSHSLKGLPQTPPPHFITLHGTKLPPFYYSSAILRYIVTRYNLPDHWYPADVTKRARVDEYLSWHCSNLRIGAAELIFSKVKMYRDQCDGVS